jgi:hypothetical protein
VVPNAKVQSRLQYFYGPYNGFYNMQKFMDFEHSGEDPRVESKQDKWTLIRSQIMNEDEQFTHYFQDSVHNMVDPAVRNSKQEPKRNKQSC